MNRTEELLLTFLSLATHKDYNRIAKMLRKATLETMSNVDILCYLKGSAPYQKEYQEDFDTFLANVFDIFVQRDIDVSKVLKDYL